MKDINKLRTIYKLKSTYRLNSQEMRKESSAEHSWSCLVLADYFSRFVEQKMDMTHVYELLMYHDLVEIDAGDTPLHPNIKSSGKAERELAAMKSLGKKLPKDLSKKFIRLFKEYEEMRTIEAKYAKAIDALDAILHEMDYKKDWKGWSRKFLIEKKGHYFEDFPQLRKEYHKILSYLEREGYFRQ